MVGSILCPFRGHRGSINTLRWGGTAGNFVLSKTAVGAANSVVLVGLSRAIDVHDLSFRKARFFVASGCRSDVDLGTEAEAV